MAGLVPFNRNRYLPTAGFDSFYNMLDDFFHDNYLSRRNLLNDSFKIDIRENDQEYIIEAEMPGIKKEEISLELNEGRLSISVVKENDLEEENKNYIHKERRYTSMQRSVYLTESTGEGITAKLQDGVLNITVPKNKKVNNRFKVNIQ